jgi:uridine phosphorylase
MSQSESRLDPKKVATHALVVGDPRRARDATALLTEPEMIWEERELNAFTGTKDGKKITIRRGSC